MAGENETEQAERESGVSGSAIVNVEEWLVPAEVKT